MQRPIKAGGLYCRPMRSYWVSVAQRRRCGDVRSMASSTSTHCGIGVRCALTHHTRLTRASCTHIARAAPPPNHHYQPPSTFYFSGINRGDNIDTKGAKAIAVAVAVAVAVTLTVTVTITNQPHTSTQVLAAGVSDASDASDALPAVSIASNLAQVSESGSDSDSGSGSTPSTSPSLAPRRTRAARKVGAGMGGEARQGALLEGWAGLGGRGGRGCRATLTTAPRCACAIRGQLSGQRGDAAGALFFAVWQLLCVGLCSQRPG